jgi:hypothetical protein
MSKVASSLKGRRVAIRYAGNLDLHKMGAQEFDWLWLRANEATTEAARERVRLDDPAVRELLALVTLHVLRRVRNEGRLKE